MILPFLDVEPPRPTLSMRAKTWYRAKHAIAAAHYEWLVWHVARTLPSVPRKRKSVPVCRRLDIIKTADLYSPVHHGHHHDDPCPTAVVDHDHPGSTLLALPQELLLAVVTALLDSESRSGRFYAARVLARACPSLAAAVHFAERQYRAARLEVTLVVVADRWLNAWAFGGDGGLFAAFDCSAADAPKALHAFRGGNCTVRVIPIDARIDPRTVVPLSWCVVPWCNLVAWPKRVDAVWDTLVLEMDPLGKHLWKAVSLELASSTLAMLVRALVTGFFAGTNVSARHVHVLNPTSIPLVTPALLAQLAALVRAPRWTVTDAMIAWDAPMPGAPLDGGAALTSLAVTASTISVAQLESALARCPNLATLHLSVHDRFVTGARTAGAAVSTARWPLTSLTLEWKLFTVPDDLGDPTIQCPLSLVTFVHAVLRPRRLRVAAWLGSPQYDPLANALVLDVVPELVTSMPLLTAIDLHVSVPHAVRALAASAMPRLSRALAVHNAVNRVSLRIDAPAAPAALTARDTLGDTWVPVTSVRHLALAMPGATAAGKLDLIGWSKLETVEMQVGADRWMDAVRAVLVGDRVRYARVVVVGAKADPVVDVAADVHERWSVTRVRSARDWGGEWPVEVMFRRR